MTQGSFAGQISQKNFNFIKELVYKRSGIILNENKRGLVYNRLVKRLNNLNMHCIEEYCDLIRNNHTVELEKLINSITTNMTYFYREKHHFEALKNKILPEVARSHSSSETIHIWSAACSAGAEPYSIAMCVLDFMESHPRYRFHITASDLNSDILQVARDGIFHQDQVKEVPAQQLQRWFLRGTAENKEYVRVKSALQQLITFKQLNLLDTWDFRRNIDIIFCRNVMIYFDKSTCAQLHKRFAELLVPNGYLVIGHSETINNELLGLKLVGKTIYQKIN
ncbi:MAG: protein-glutamate O-methyltransferase CheR [Gammaproteobacteria bacterium]